jgi:carboxyl-terminal processing protease
LASGYPGAPANCNVPTQKDWLVDYMNDDYYWFDKMGRRNDAATGPADFLDSLIYQPLDRYSAVLRTEEFLTEVADGQSLGWGDDYLVWSSAARTSLTFALIEPLSPLGQEGVKRGDEVISIDGRNPRDIAANGLRSATSQADPRTFVIKDSTGTQRTILRAANLYNLTPVQSAKVLTTTSATGTTVNVGYLSYTQFIDAGNAGLGRAFNDFAAKGVQELILDLRYNGGGGVRLARDLSSMIGGPTLNNQVFIDLRANAKNQASNFKLPFVGTGLPGAQLRGLKRLIVIASQDTASASELVINSLRPFLNEIVLIGEKTYGKPFASQPRDACGLTYAIIIAQLFNSRGEGAYTDGIAPTCNVADDFTRPFGDPAERRLSAALNYIQTGTCPALASKAEAHSAQAPFASRLLNPRRKLALMQ